MSNIEKTIFCRVLKSLRPPDGYASNISRHVSVEKHTIWGLKSHDNHVLMQNILPIALRRALPKDVVMVFIELSNFFRTICSKVNTTSDLEKIQDRIALTLCHLEKIFPPAFFDIMEHLPIHLAEEALLAGPVQFRWMYPVERYLGTLKKYVRNRAHPEGSIAKGDDNVMFQCDWVDNEKGVKEDELKFTLVNFNRLMYDRNLPTDEPFVLASQVQQVWYIPDPVDPDWNVVVPMSRRDNYDVYSTAEVEPHSSIQLDDSISNSNEDSYWVRDGIEGIFVDEAYTTMDGVET